INWLPDYVSLLKSRRLLSKMAHSSFSMFVGLAAVDLVLTALIAVAVIIISVVVLAIRSDESVPWGDMLTIIKSAFVVPRASSETSILQSLLPVFVYTTFMTSIWVMLYT